MYRYIYTVFIFYKNKIVSFYCFYLFISVENIIFLMITLKIVKL